MSDDPSVGVKKIIDSLLRRSVWIKYAPLWVAFIIYMVFSPILTGFWGEVFQTILFSILLITSVFLVIDNRRTLVGVSLLVFVTLISKWVAFYDGGSVALAISLFLSIVTFSIITLFMFRSLFQIKEVTTSTLWRAISVYILIGLAWGMFYSLYELLAPGSYIDSFSPATSPSTATMIYYSFVTLATLGYGDILPATQEARNITVIEVIVGVLYLAILISRLVGTWKPGGQKEGGGG